MQFISVRENFKIRFYVKAVLSAIVLFVVPEAYGVEVPSEMEFAGMELKLTESVRRLLKSDIELITRGQKSYQLKIERANLYFPVIEKIFQEENLPLDFKFLSLQESSLVPDAVSSSNAVGYWQFKKESAMEVGLRVDHHVDERMNIIAASRGAAKYLKKNNTALNNWIYALLSYNLGLGGVKSKVEEKYIGAKRMTIDKDMHWYVIRFLAHKLAYQDVVGKVVNPTLVLAKYLDCHNKSLKDISRETEVEEESLLVYNKWILKNRIPDDKEYYVVLPVTPDHKQKLIALNIIYEEGGERTPGTVPTPQEPVAESRDPLAIRLRFRKEKGAGADKNTGTGDIAMLTVVNGIRAIMAKEGDTPEKLALRGGIHTFDFLRYNEMKNFETVVPGQIYFLQPKRNKGLVVFHTLEPGETLWSVAQKYGIRTEAIRSKNRMERTENPIPGRVLWLRSKRPKDVEIEIKPVQTVPEKTDPVPAPEKVQILPEEVPDGPKVEELPAGSVSPNQVLVSTVSDNAASNSIPVPDSTETESVFHDVKPGETLYGISRIYSVPVETLKSWNNLVTNDIKPGNQLIVKKGGSTTERSLIEHRVQAGENLYQISRRYGVSISDIQKWNGKQDLKVSVGEKIIIKK